MENFFEYYELLSSSNDFIGKYTAKQDFRNCRFCGLGYPNTTFKNRPHIIPELFGRNKTSSNYECDNCNMKFQRFESDASAMVVHYLSFLNIRTKKGLPVFKSEKKDKKYSTEIRPDGNQTNLHFWDNHQDFKYDKENKTLTVRFRTQRFVPFFVYKVFLKIGILLLPDKEYSENLHFLECLLSDRPIESDAIPRTAFRYMLKAKRFLKPQARVFKAKRTLIDKTVIPEYTLVLDFANVTYQFYLPISRKNICEYEEGQNLKLLYYPAFVLDDFRQLKSIECHHIDLGKFDKITITDTFVLKYDELIEDINNSR